VITFLLDLIYQAGFMKPLVVLEALLVILVVAGKLRIGEVKIPGWLLGHPWRAILAAALLPLAVRALLLPVYPVPAPANHDEYGNLLLGDTFAHGRLSNPSHPLWIHFESFHILQQPGYFSFRPPGPGLFLAVGQWLGGYPWTGVWLSMGGMTAAICWMLQGWFPQRWALLGALLAAIQVGSISYWMNSYWGGAAAAIGGAVMAGALGRLRRRPEARWTLVLVAGFALLLNTRLLEGGLMGMGTAGAILLVPRLRNSWRGVLLPGFAGLILTAGWMAYYNYRLTGSPTLLPYKLGLETYKVAPSLAWEKQPPPKQYNHEILRRCYEGWELDAYLKWKKRPLMASYLSNIAHVWQFYVRPALTIPLVMLPWVLRGHRLRPLWLMAAPVMAGLAVMVWYNPHYLAGITCVVYGAVIQGLRYLKASPRPAARPLAGAAPVLCSVTMVLALGLTAAGWQDDYRSWFGRFPEMREREHVLERLRAAPGQHLVVVRYGPEHDYFREWVYNEADIETAKVVWAREMSPGNNRRLIEHFRKRQAWLIEPDTDPGLLKPYSAGLIAQQ
jgi:hypothetical protein